MEFLESLVPVGIVLLCLGGAAAFVALAYFLFNITKSLMETMGKVNVLLEDVKELTEKSKPVIERVDPMMDRVTLTIDAANLEIMRVDQILEDVNSVTANMAKAFNAVDTATSVPLGVIAGAASKLRDRIAPLTYGNDASKVTAAARTVDSGLDAVEDMVEQAQAENAAKKAVADAAALERDGKQEEANEAASALKDGVYVRIESDTKFEA